MVGFVSRRFFFCGFDCSLILQFRPSPQFGFQHKFPVVGVFVYNDELAVVDVAEVFKVFDGPVVPELC